MVSAFTSVGQILSYTSATSGALSAVTPNSTGTALILVNGATSPGSSCGTGFSSAGFSSTATYSSSLAAIEVSCAPNTGFSLNVTGFSAGLRRSASGPASVRYAYSTDGGTTWTNQGSNQVPDNASCDTTTTATWNTSVTVTAPNTLKFRIYGFNAGSSAGTFQILNLNINGSVSSSHGGSGGTSKIVYYFNQPVDTTVSTGTYAKSLYHCLADTLIAYINRAKYSIDIAQYEYNQTSGYSNIATAVNNAYSRGVAIRWIYCAAGNNSGLSGLNSSINTLESPAAGSISPCSHEYSIMHNKFVVIDANSSNPNDALVWTGSPDWNVTQFNSDYNNVVILQDSALAHAYRNQFNLMWGSSTTTPNAAASLWGPCKPNSGHHIFSIGGKEVELYFTPSDSTNSHILSTIQTANTDLYFGMYTFTNNPDATQVVNEYSADGVTVDGIVDEYSVSYSAYTTLNTGLGTTHLKVYDGGAYIYHNKYVIVDPSNICSDPIVLTGSHNWTASADLENDENTLIIHDPTAANIYYQAFKSDFASLGGSLSHISVAGGCGTVYSREAESLTNLPLGPEDVVNVFPNPSTGTATIHYELTKPEHVSIRIFNAVGQIVKEQELQSEEQGQYNYNFTPAATGLYIIHIKIGNFIYIRKLNKI
jgi:phosphatidylserine/phosphatidylglycerophosphate/cardiolipin synthase-like enzyme